MKPSRLIIVCQISLPTLDLLSQVSVAKTVIAELIAPAARYAASLAILARRERQHWPDGATLL